MKIRRALSLLIAVFLLSGMLSGCGSKDNSSATASSTSTSAGSTSTSDQDNPQPGEPKLPITTTSVSFKIWQVTGADITKTMSQLGESDYYKELETRTGVHVEFIHPAIGQEKESLNLLFASGTLPDIIDMIPGGWDYPGGFDKGIADGVLIKLNDLIDKYAPNYKALINSSPDIKKDSITDGGNIPGFYTLDPENTPNNWYGPVVRQDWLEDLGIKTPQTYDEWYEMLKAFKEKKGATAPLMLFSTGFVPFGVFNGGFGAGENFYQVDGKIKYGPLEPGYKDYLQMLNKWYSEGLIDKDFATKKDFLPSATFTTTGKAGVWFDSYAMIPVNKQLSTDKNFKEAALPYPALKAGDKNPFVGNNSRVTEIWTLTSACKDLETAVKWIDYNYSPEGSKLACWGIEGKTYTVEADNKLMYTDLILKNPDGLTRQQAGAKYLGSGGGHLRFSSAEYVGMPAEAMDAMTTWGNTTSNAYVIPGAAVLTTDEGIEYAQIYTDIETYVYENTLKFILGQEPMSKYDDFVNQIKGMNIDRVLQLKQASLDRYNKR